MRTTVQVHAERVDGGRSGAGVGNTEEAEEPGGARGGARGGVGHVSHPAFSPSLSHTPAAVRPPASPSLCSYSTFLPLLGGVGGGSRGEDASQGCPVCPSRHGGGGSRYKCPITPFLHVLSCWGHGRNKYCHRRSKDAGGDRVGKLGACWESLSGSQEALSPPAALPLVFVASMFGGGRSWR